MCAIELDSSCAGNAAAAAAAAAQTDSNVCTLGKKQHKVNAAAKREIRRGSAGIRCVWLVFFFLACQCCCLCALACSPSRFFSLLALHQVHLCPDTLASFVLFSCPSLISVCVWCGYSYVLLPLFNLSLFVWGGGGGTCPGHSGRPFFGWFWGSFVCVDVWERKGEVVFELPLCGVSAILLLPPHHSSSSSTSPSPLCDLAKRPHHGAVEGLARASSLDVRLSAHNHTRHAHVYLLLKGGNLRCVLLALLVNKWHGVVWSLTGRREGERRHALAR